MSLAPAAAELTGITQRKLSALTNDALECSPVERLMTLLTALDRAIEIVIRRKRPLRPSARIRVGVAR